MKRVHLNKVLSGLLPLALVLISSQRGTGGTMRIVHSIPFPGVAQFGCDIAWDGQYIWTAFYETVTVPNGGNGEGVPRVRSLDPVDGSPGPSFQFGQGMDNRSGIVWDGSHFWVTRTAGVHARPGEFVPDYIHKFAPNGTEVASFEFPESLDMSATGLAFDGTYLWLSDAREDRLLQLDPQDMSLVKSFATPGSIPLGLAWKGSSLFSVDGETDNIFEIDTSGNVLEVWSTPLADPFGITYDGEYFWVLDNRTSRIYQLALPEPSAICLVSLAAWAFSSHFVTCQVAKFTGGRSRVRRLFSRRA